MKNTLTPECRRHFLALVDKLEGSRLHFERHTFDAYQTLKWSLVKLIETDPDESIRTIAWEIYLEVVDLEPKQVQFFIRPHVTMNDIYDLNESIDSTVESLRKLVDMI